MKTPINKKTLTQHFQYSWWMYLLSAVLCFFLWDLMYTVTAPRTPDNEKLELYLYAYGEENAVNDYLEKVHTTEMSDVTEMTAQYIMPDESSGPMVLATRIMAGEGDLYLLPRDFFQSYASQGLFVALDELEGIQEMFEAAGINIERGWRKNQDTNERHLYGLPTSSLNIIPTWTYSTSSEMYLTVRLYNGNDENAEKLLRIILRDSMPAVSQETQTGGSV